MIRSDDVERADASAGLGGDEREPTVPGGPALPYNDNAREDDARDEAGWADGPARMRDRDFAGLSAPSAAEASSALRSRRRGPRVTRWIGFAAQRRRARERADRLRDRGNRACSDPSDG